MKNGMKSQCSTKNKENSSKHFVRDIKIFCVLLFSAGGIISCKQEKPMEVILCIGQSNMAGRAEIPKEATGTLKNVFLFNDKDEWEPAKNPLNRYSTIRNEIRTQGLGPAWSFAQRFQEKFPDKKLGLVVNVRGGTSIDAWSKGSYYYNESMIKALKAQRTGAKIIGIIWHQGEADRNKHEGYTEKFADMAKQLRADLGQSNLPIVIGEIGDWKGDSKAINAEIRSIVNKVDNVGCVDVDGLSHMGDSLHFSSRAQLELGERYADKYLELLDGN